MPNIKAISLKITKKPKKTSETTTQRQLKQCGKGRLLYMIGILTLTMAGISETANAALPPEYQNAKDLEVMVSFAKQHSDIIQSLEFIDFQNKRLGFHDWKSNQFCMVTFVRGKSTLPLGYVGPEADLVFADSTCEIFTE